MVLHRPVEPAALIGQVISRDSIGRCLRWCSTSVAIPPGPLLAILRFSKCGRDASPLQRQRPDSIRVASSLGAPTCCAFRNRGRQLPIETACVLRQFLRWDGVRKVAHRPRTILHGIEPRPGLRSCAGSAAVVTSSTRPGLCLK
jgi:hypothetical protein